MLICSGLTCLGRWRYPGASAPGINQHNPRIITGNPFGQTPIYTRPLWRYFDTKWLTALDQRFQQVVVKKKILIGGYIESSEVTEQAVDTLHMILDDAHSSGKDKIGSCDLRQQLVQRGISLSQRAVSSMLERMGVRRITSYGKTFCATSD